MDETPATRIAPTTIGLMRSHIRTIIIVSLMVGLMWFFLRNADLARVWEEVRRARWDLLTVGLMLMLGSYLIRVARWRHLLRPVGQTRFSSAFRATAMGFAANAVMPGRVGEVLRPFALARRERLSAAAAFGTIVIERLLDLATVVLIFSGFILLFDPQMPVADAGLLATLKTGATLMGVAAVVALGLVFLAAGDPERAGRFVMRFARVAPGGLVHRLTMIAQRFLEGLAVTRRARPLIVAMLWSLPLWVCVALSIWLVSAAFAIDVPLGGSVILMGLVVVGVAVPTPAGVGGYHAAYQLGATALYGAAVDQAVGAALVLHVFSFGPITVLGLLFMAQDGLKLTGLRTLGTDVEVASAEMDGGTADPSGDLSPNQASILPVQAEDDRSAG